MPASQTLMVYGDLAKLGMNIHLQHVMGAWHKDIAAFMRERIMVSAGFETMLFRAKTEVEGLGPAKIT